LDIPALYRLRGQVLSFDTINNLTRGNPLHARAFLDYLDPARGIYTAINGTSGNILYAGQITHNSNSRSSNLSFVAPPRALTSQDLARLVDHLAEQAGEWGTFHLLAEVDEHSHAFDVLRTCGFSVYAWQRIWKYTPPVEEEPVTENYNFIWKKITSQEHIAIRSLCLSLVPAFVQPVETLFDKHMDGLVCHYDCNINGYADIITGREGVWVQPYIHPEADHVPEMINELLRIIYQKGMGPVFLCVRSYQAWIESALEYLPVLASPRKALLVRHLALLQKVTSPVSVSSFQKHGAKATVVHAKRQNQV